MAMLQTVRSVVAILAMALIPTLDARAAESGTLTFKCPDTFHTKYGPVAFDWVIKVDLDQQKIDRDAVPPVFFGFSHNTLQQSRGVYFETGFLCTDRVSINDREISYAKYCKIQFGNSHGDPETTHDNLILHETIDRQSGARSWETSDSHGVRHAAKCAKQS